MEQLNLFSYPKTPTIPKEENFIEIKGVRVPKESSIIVKRYFQHKRSPENYSYTEIICQLHKEFGSEATSLAEIYIWQISEKNKRPREVRPKKSSKPHKNWMDDYDNY